MAKDPAFLFYSQDFIVGVQMLSFEDRGKYITLLAQMHQHGRMSLEEINILVGEISPRLKSKFSSDKNGLFFNKRLESEVNRRMKYSQSRRNNALKTENKKKHMQSICKAYASDMHKHMENENEIENENINVKKKLKKKKYNFEEVWNMYPKQIGKKKALSCFNQSIKTDQDFEDIKTAIKNYTASERFFKGYVMNGSNWFADWQAWKTQIDPLCDKCKNRGKFISSTGYESICSCPRGQAFKS